MTRKRRQWFPGAMYHIVCRGNRKTDLFLERRDYMKYLSLLDNAFHYSNFYLHAFCLMTNHLHLLIGTKEDPPGKVMHSVNTMYASYFNKKYELSGHVFQDRYFASPISSSFALMKVSAYIHNNPREAFLTEHPEDYPWSSYYAYILSNDLPNTIVKEKQTRKLNYENREYIATRAPPNYQEDPTLPEAYYKIGNLPLAFSKEKLTSLFPVPSHIHYKKYVEREWNLSCLVKEDKK